MKKLMISLLLLASSASVGAQNRSLPPAPLTSDPEIYLASSSFDTFFYVDRASITTEGTFKVFNMTYVQNGYRGLVVSSIKAAASCSAPYKVQLWEETVYYKDAPKDAQESDFVLQPIETYTSFPSSEVVKDNATLNEGRYSFWGQTWLAVCHNQWKNKHALGNATVKLMVLDARNISKRSLGNTVVQTTQGKKWIYRANTPPQDLTED